MGLEPLRVGVVGLGLMGRRHASILAHRPDAILCGGVDLDPATRDGFGVEFDTAVHARLDDLLSDAPDAVVICLPDNAHRDATCAALRAGSHVLVEKPLATSTADAGAMVAAAAEADRRLLVGFTMRFDPRHRGAREAVRSGRVGEVSLVHARRNSARGAAQRYGRSTSLPWHVTSHDIDAVLDLTGRRVREVTARATAHRFGELDQLDALGALLVLDNGAPVVVESSWVLPTAMKAAIDSRLEIVGTDGVVEVAGMDEGLRLVDGAGFDYPDVLRYSPDAGSGPGGALGYELAHFLDVCRGASEPEVTIAEALHTVEVVEALETALAENGTVTVDRREETS